MEKTKNHPAETTSDDDRCMLDPNKICDNCFRCLDGDTREYAEIKIDRVLLFDPTSTEEEADVSMNRGHMPHIRVHPITIPNYRGRHQYDLPREEQEETPAD